MEMNGVIMLVEDSEDDREMMRFAFRKAGVENPVCELHSGDEAIAYLSGHGQYVDRERWPLPCIIITDLKMPRMNGFDLLQWMRERPEFDPIPRIVDSTSSREDDRKRAGDLGACAYFQKPLQLDHLVELVRHLDATWIAKHCPMMD